MVEVDEAEASVVSEVGGIVIVVVTIVASKSCKGCFCKLRDAAGLGEGDRMGDSSASEHGEEGEDGGDMEDELLLSEFGDEQSPSCLETLRFTLARLF